MANSDKPEMDLDAIRAEIDQVDRSILALLEQRFDLTSRVASAKKSQRIFRPGREAELIRSLIAISTLDPLLIETVWRQIIAFSLDGQKKLDIAVAHAEGVEDTARFRYGAVARYQRSDASGVLDAVLAGRADIGVLPHWQGAAWLDELVQRRRDGAEIFIVAATPMVACDGLVPTVLVGRYLPDPSGDDLTLSHDGIGLAEENGYAPDAPNIVGIIQRL